MSVSSWFAGDHENVAPEVLWEDGERVCRRMHIAGSDGARHEFVTVLSAAEVPSPEGVKRLAHEYDLKDSLDSAWAVRPLELVRDRGQTLLVIEHPRGEPLSRLIGPPMDIGQFLRIAVALSAALGRLHGRGLIHKDIKPSNILANSATGEVWLTGFGIASRLPRERQTPVPPGSIAGTLAYMSPEQTGRMNRSIDARSDLYSLGVTLYQMLTGVLPFAAADPLEWVHCHIARQPVAPADRREVSESLSAITMRLLAKNAEERYQTAAGLEADLRRCVSQWQSHGRIESFPLGTDDLSDRLLIPEKLYGREREVEALLTAFDRVVAQGTAELVLVSGYSGVGKSSVVNELHKVLVRPRGLFASGKFDQYKRDVPYATLAEAFQMLVREILVKSEAEVDHWRRALMDALGPNGQLMVNLIPEVEFIIGKQPPVAELPPQEERGRFQLVFRRFLGAFARPEHPLALFLDDLQWLDTATLELLERLATDPDVRHVLLIGAYRDNEVNSSHPLTRTMTEIREAGAKTQEIVLAPLGLDDVERVVADALHCTRNSAATLALLVHEKTGGNPFFAIQFVTSLVEEGQLRFDRGAASWSWDLDHIHAKGYTDNVVDLLIGKLSRLPAQTQMALQQLACLGHLAEVTTLSIILDTSEEQLHLAMWPVVREVLIERLPGAYRFVHDRIQEAAYLLIPTDMRSAAHLRIGRLLLSHTPPEMQQEAIFEIVNQLNRALALITSRDERERLAELNLIAGKRAKSSTAYVSALKYLITGVEILGDRVWESRRDLIFALELERAGCEFLTGGLVAADERLTALSNRAANTIERAALACLHIDVCTTLDQSGRAVAVTLEYLRHVGIVWSPHPTEQEARREYERTWSLLKGREIEDLIDLPVITNPELVGTLDVLERGLNPALFTDAKLLSLMICGLVNLSLEHGNAGASCNGYAWLAMIAGPTFGNYKAGFRFGRLGYDLVERPELERFKAHTYLSFAVLIIPWSMHVRTGKELIHRAFHAAIAMGDLPTAASCGVDLFGNLLTAGHPLADVQREAERSLEFAQKAGFGLLIDISRTQLALIRTLRGFTTTFGCFNDAQFDELQFESRSSSEEGRAIGSCWYWVRKLQARFFAGDYVTAVAASLNAHRLLWTSPSFLETAEAHFYGALSHAACCDAASPVQYSQHIEALTAHHRQLVEWAENCPENFENRAALVGAEIARIEGRDLDAMRLYEKAIKSAHENEFVHNEALANELAGRFYLARGIETAGYTYLRNARHCFNGWGAGGKVKQLDELYSRLRQERTSASAAVAEPAVQLDVESVVKASQAISSEIILPRLIEKLVRIAVENSGAERGLLILIQGGEPQIEAEATTGPVGIEVVAGQGQVTASDLPQSALHYVIRTQERVLLDDASADSVYSKDEYVRRKRSKSVLCLPIVKQTKLIGALYLENNLAPFVFTPDRVAVLQLLASQAAISLENTSLYSDLQLQAGLLQRLPVSAWTLKLDGTPDFVNQVWLEFSGQTLDFVRSHPEAWMTAVHPEDREAASRAFWGGVRSGQGFAMETRSLRAQDGTYRWHLIQAVVLRDAEGKVLKFVGTTTDIDDQKRAEEALRESEQSFRLILDGIAGLVAIMSSSGAVEVVNRQALEYFGRTSDQLKGWSTGDAVHPDDLPSVYSAWMHSVETVSVYDVDHRLRRADGVYRWFHARGLPLCDSEGHALRWYVLLTDIHDRKQAEEALQDNERNLVSIINTIPTMVWSTRADGYCEFVNQRWLEYTGTSMGQAQGWSWGSVIHPDDQNVLIEHWQSCLDSGTPLNTEARMRRFDGVYRWHLFLGNPLRDASGNIANWYGTNVDIDDRKRADEALQANERNLVSIINTIPTTAWSTRPDGYCEFLSERWLNYAGMTSEEAQGWAWADVIHPDDARPLYEYWTSCLASGTQVDTEARMRRFDGVYRWFLFRANPLRDESGTIVRWYGSNIDIDDRKRAEEALAGTRAELAHVTRVTSLGVLTASMAHEINQPLSGIITNASTCLRMLDANPPNLDGARETARRTMRDGNRASDVITRLRALYSKKEPSIEPMDLNEAAREVIALLLSELQRNGVILQHEFADRLAIVQGDRIQLQQVILNLVRNASDAMSGIDDRPRRLLIRTEQVDENVCLTVQDSGIGFDTKIAGRLFESFYTTKTDGMGIGLSVSRSIIEAHHGQLWAKANDGPGATFAFSIPWDVPPN